MRNAFVIGISGVTASGKTTVCDSIINYLNENNILTSDENVVTILSQDRYYIGGDENTNYDIPSALDFDTLVKHLSLLKDGQSIEAPK
jgi:uridine kinase